jgi:fibronectin-binding autotransporter adhesin
VAAVRPAGAQEGLFLYVPNFNDNTVTVLETGADLTPSVLATLSGVGTTLLSATVRADQAYAYVSSRATNQVFVVDTRTRSVVQTVSTGGQPAELVFSPNGSRAYVANNGGSVSVYDVNALTGRLTSVTTIATGGGSGSRSITVSPDGTRVYAGDQQLDRVIVIDASTNSILTTVTVGDQPLDVGIKPDGSRLYVTNFTDSTLSIVDTATNTVVTTVSLDFGGTLGRGPDGVVVSPDGRYVYVANRTTGNVSILDTNTNATVGITSVGSQANGVVVSPDGTALYVTSQGASDRVNFFTINTSTGMLTANGTAAVGDSPVQLGMCSGGGGLLGSGATFLARTGGALGCAGATASFTGGTLTIGADNLDMTTPVALGSGGGTLDTNGNAATLSGGITGTGALNKVGEGTLTLAGTNTYSGATLVREGTLRAGAAEAFSPNSATTVGAGAALDLNGFDQTVGSLAGAGQVTFGGATLTAGGDGTSTSFSGRMTGFGGLTKTGSGTLTLTGTNTFAGTATISQGTLAVGDAAHSDASLASDVSLGDAGRLIGYGLIGGSVRNQGAGTVAPGGSIGTLRIGGDYLQGPDGILSIEVSPGETDRLLVEGTAYLDGTLALSYEPGTYGETSYTILEAGNAEGDFASVGGTPPSGVVAVTDVVGGDVILGLFNTDTAPAGSTVLTAPGTVALRSGAQVGEILMGRMAGGVSGRARAPGVALAGPDPTAVQFAAAGVDPQAGALLDTLPEGMRALGGWFQAYGALGELEGGGAAPGIDTQTGGVLAGLDRPLGDGFFAGVAAGYGYTSVWEGADNSGSLETPRVLAYGGWETEVAVLSATLGYGHHFLHYERPVAATGRTAEAEWGAHELLAAAQASAPLAFGRVSLLPRAGLRYLRLFEDSVTEDEAGGFDLAAEGRTPESLRPFVALGAAYGFGGERLQVVPSVEVGYSRELLDAAPARDISLGGGSFVVPALEPARDRVTLSGGLDLAVGKRLEVNAGYEAELPLGNTFEQTFQAGLTFRF